MKSFLTLLDWLLEDTDYKGGPKEIAKQQLAVRFQRQHKKAMCARLRKMPGSAVKHGKLTHKGRMMKRFKCM